MDIVRYFECALACKAQPLLLEFTHPTKRTRLDICGVWPKIILEVWGNSLYRNGVKAGQALDIFRHLSLAKSDSFFPAFLGFFAYEFAQFFGKPCKPGFSAFPLAYFSLYDQGLVIDGETVIHHDPLPQCEAPPSDVGKQQNLRPAITDLEFHAKVALIKEGIRAGDVYQVNFSMPFYFDAHHDEMLSIYRSMRFNNKSPFMGVVKSDDWRLLSGSPERLFSLIDGTIVTRPIAGTKKRGASRAEDDLQLNLLTECPKENAEHAMLVDLMRNDLNQVAKPCTVTVSEDRTVEFYSHVMHLVSEIRATTDAPLEDIMRALFPGGTITGAPKLSVMNTIADLETVARGPYTGSLGYISSGFGLDFNILIRSVFQHRDRGWINTGAGIVIDSDPHNEWRELQRKAMAIGDILLNRAQKLPHRDMIFGPKIGNNLHKASYKAEIFFLENHDSFSFNIVDAFRALGARVEVASSFPPALDCFSHVVMGPGPGNPTNMPKLSDIISHALSRRLPILGICLGHQAIGHFFQVTVRKLKEPVHGKCHSVIHGGEGLFSGITSPASFARYHSLAVAEAPKDFVVDAYTHDDCIMAMRHKTLPVFGVQFHPESYLSHDGHILLANFLQRGAAWRSS